MIKTLIKTMKAYVFGDSNVDITVYWKEAESRLAELSKRQQELISSNIGASKQARNDIEVYLPSEDNELSRFFNSIKKRVEFGGCGAIKARTMALLGHDVTFYSWVGDDKRGKMILKQLEKAGVDVSNVLVDGATCETFNLFDPNEARLAFSYWETKLPLDDFITDVRGSKPDEILLTGGHRIKSDLGYTRIPEAYVFTGSFAAYSRKELDRKYKSDFSKGILMANDVEIRQLSGEKSVIKGMRNLSNELIVMHGPKTTAVKRGDEIISSMTEPVDRSRVKELTGIGDVWEAVFLASVGDVRTAPESALAEAMKLADRASVYRMLTGDMPLA
jgi:sugar/nucleoside kinase (ribokinase family)